MQHYSQEPVDRAAHRRRFDRFYTRVARAYDLFVKAVPLWRRWLRRAMPHLQGPKVLEVSFGTGYLLTSTPGGSRPTASISTSEWWPSPARTYAGPG